MNRNIIALIVVIVATAVVIYGNFNINFNLFNSIISVLVFWLLYVLTLKNDELKHVKGEYKKQKEQLHDVLEYSSNWIAYKDLDGKITEEGVQVCPFFYAVLFMIKAEGINVNIMQENIWKLNEEVNEILKQNNVQILEFTDVTIDEAEKISNYEKLVIEKTTTVDYNMEIKTNGDLEYFHVIKSPLLDEHDNVCGTSTICVNTTESTFSTKVKELYTESLAHDFKNPILAQYKALEALKSGILGDLNSEQMEIVQQIGSSCKFVEQMLNAQLSN